jgi:hypothetical protein
LVFVLLAFGTYWKLERSAEILWLCNVANLVLAVGLIARSERLLWIAALWLAAGLPLWVWDVAFRERLFLHSVLTHPVAAMLALLLLRNASRGPKRWVWLEALAGGLAVQIISRFVTPAALNVNASQRPYAAVAVFFESYALYFICNALFVGALLFAVQWMLAKLIASAGGKS